MRITATGAVLAARPRHGGRALDFVVLGFGVGALFVLLGLLLRDHGPRIRRLKTNQDQPWGEVAGCVAWRRTCRAGGLLLAADGVFVGVVTLIAVGARASDEAGLLVVLVATAATIVSMVAWAARYRRVTTGFGLRRYRHRSPHLAAEAPVEAELAPAVASGTEEAVVPAETKVEPHAAVVNDSPDDRDDLEEVVLSGDEAAAELEGPVADEPSDNEGSSEAVEDPEPTGEADEQPPEEPDELAPPTPEGSANGTESDAQAAEEVTSPSAMTQEKGT